VTEMLDILAAAPFWIAVLRVATPLIFGTLGVLLCERAGVLNLGIEGIMVAGAFAGWLAVYYGAGLWTGVLIAACTGAVFGVLHGLLTVILPFTETHWFDRVPLIGTALGAQTALTLLALAIVPLIAYVLNRTPAGLAVRMVGENPAAVEAQGISVAGVRIGAIAAGSALMGVAGAFLTLSAFNAFYFNMVNGRGWICVALVVFASWRPGKALLGSILFAAFDALQLRLQQSSAGVLPYQLYLMMPYLLSILALALVARKAAYPQALMKPYRKGER
jgi:ABC-type uncharacterized transport system permease subunit